MMRDLTERGFSSVTYELCLCLRLVGDGVANHPGVHEGEGRYEALGQAG